MYDNGIAELNVVEAALNRDDDEVHELVREMTANERESLQEAFDLINSAIDIVPAKVLS